MRSRNSATWLAAVMGCVSVAASCSVDLPGSTTCLESLTADDPDGTCRGLVLKPWTGDYGSIILKRDTLTVRAVSDSGYAAARWSIAAPQLAAVVNGGHVQDVAGPVDRIVVRGMAPGTGQVVATYVPRSISASTVITVLDSSAITEVSFVFTPTLSTGSTETKPITLRDAMGRAIRAQPESVYTSNPAFATVERTDGVVLGESVTSYILRTHAAGTVNVVADFLTLRKSVTVTITP